MEREDQTFEEARAEGIKRLERFVRYLYGENVEIINTIEPSLPEADSHTDHISAA